MYYVQKTKQNHYVINKSNKIMLELDSMCWFSHWCSTTPKNAPSRPRPRGRLPNKMLHFFIFFVSGDLDFWPWHSNSGEIFVQCI